MWMLYTQGPPLGQRGPAGREPLSGAALPQRQRPGCHSLPLSSRESADMAHFISSCLHSFCQPRGSRKDDSMATWVLAWRGLCWQLRKEATEIFTHILNADHGGVWDILGTPERVKVSFRHTSHSPAVVPHTPPQPSTRCAQDSKTRPGGSRARLSQCPAGNVGRGSTGSLCLILA